MARCVPNGLGQPPALTVAAVVGPISSRPKRRATAPSVPPAATPRAWRRLRWILVRFISPQSGRASLEDVDSRQARPKLSGCSLLRDGGADAAGSHPMLDR